MTTSDSIRIPVGRDEDGRIIDASFYLPLRMTEAQWAAMHETLAVMKPVLVGDAT